MRSRIVVSFGIGLMFALAPAAQAQTAGPPDSFDIDVLTAYRYGLNHDWAPANCFGRRYCPEDHRHTAASGTPSQADAGS